MLGDQEMHLPTEKEMEKNRVASNLRNFKWICNARKRHDGIFCDCMDFKIDKKGFPISSIKKDSMCWKLHILEREYNEAMNKLQEKINREVWKIQKRTHQKLKDLGAFKEYEEITKKNK